MIRKLIKKFFFLEVKCVNYLNSGDYQTVQWSPIVLALTWLLNIITPSKITALVYTILFIITILPFSFYASHWAHNEQPEFGFTIGSCARITKLFFPFAIAITRNISLPTESAHSVLFVNCKIKSVENCTRKMVCCNYRLHDKRHFSPTTSLKSVFERAKQNKWQCI